MFDFITVTDRELIIFLGILIALNCVLSLLLTWFKVGSVIEPESHLMGQSPECFLKRMEEKLKKKGEL